MSEDEAKHKDPLHGKTLKVILEALVERYGWVELSARIAVNCFAVNPSLNSSLTFLRRTPWARAKVENLYLEMLGHAGAGRGPRPKPAFDAVKAPTSVWAKRKVERDDGSKVEERPINPWTGQPY